MMGHIPIPETRARPDSGRHPVSERGSPNTPVTVPRGGTGQRAGESAHRTGPVVSVAAGGRATAPSTGSVGSVRAAVAPHPPAPDTSRLKFPETLASSRQRSVTPPAAPAEAKPEWNSGSRVGASRSGKHEVSQPVLVKGRRESVRPREEPVVPTCNPVDFGKAIQEVADTFSYDAIKSQVWADYMRSSPTGLGRLPSNSFSGQLFAAIPDPCPPLTLTWTQANAIARELMVDSRNGAEKRVGALSPAASVEEIRNHNNEVARQFPIAVAYHTDNLLFYFLLVWEPAWDEDMIDRAALGPQGAYCLPKSIPHWRAVNFIPLPNTGDRHHKHSHESHNYMPDLFILLHQLGKCGKPLVTMETKPPSPTSRDGEWASVHHLDELLAEEGRLAAAEEAAVRHAADEARKAEEQRVRLEEAMRAARAAQREREEAVAADRASLAARQAAALREREEAEAAERARLAAEHAAAAAQREREEAAAVAERQRRVQEEHRRELERVQAEAEEAARKKAEAEQRERQAAEEKRLADLEAIKQREMEREAEAAAAMARHEADQRRKAEEDQARAVQAARDSANLMQAVRKAEADRMKAAEQAAADQKRQREEAEAATAAAQAAQQQAAAAAAEAEKRRAEEARHAAEEEAARAAAKAKADAEAARAAAKAKADAEAARLAEEEALRAKEAAAAIAAREAAEAEARARKQKEADDAARAAAIELEAARQKQIAAEEAAEAARKQKEAEDEAQRVADRKKAAEEAEAARLKADEEAKAAEHRRRISAAKATIARSLKAVAEVKRRSAELKAQQAAAAKAAEDEAAKRRLLPPASGSVVVAAPALLPSHITEGAATAHEASGNAGRLTHGSVTGTASSGSVDAPSAEEIAKLDAEDKRKADEAAAAALAEQQRLHAATELARREAEKAAAAEAKAQAEAAAAEAEVKRIADEDAARKKREEEAAAAEQAKIDALVQGLITLDRDLTAAGIVAVKGSADVQLLAACADLAVLVQGQLGQLAHAETLVDQQILLATAQLRVVMGRPPRK